MINNYFIKVIIFFSATFFLGCDENGQAPAPPFPRVTLSATPPSIPVGDSLILDVNVENIEHLFAISFEILFDTSFVEVVMEMDSGFVDYSSSNTNDTFFGPVVYLGSLGVLSVAYSANNISGKIISFTIKGIKATKNETALELDKQKINLIQKDGLILSDLKISDLHYSIVRGVTIQVTDE